MKIKQKLTLEEKAVAACRSYVAISNEIKQIGNDIGEALSKCPTQWAENKTHLSQFYDCGASTEYFDDDDYYGSNEDAINAFKACAHCVKANALIQERKAARRRLGAAKRAITIAGRGA